jgi:hypothetical protein
MSKWRVLTTGGYILATVEADTKEEAAQEAKKLMEAGTIRTVNQVKVRKA